MYYVQYDVKDFVNTCDTNTRFRNFHDLKTYLQGPNTI